MTPKQESSGTRKDQEEKRDNRGQIGHEIRGKLGKEKDKKIVIR